MIFDKCKVYTTLNADELKIGSRLIVADNLLDLKGRVEINYPAVTLRGIRPEYKECRFATDDDAYMFAYLVAEPSRLAWTDLKVGDIIVRDNIIIMVTRIDLQGTADRHIFAGMWIEDDELKEWRKQDD